MTEHTGDDRMQVSVHYHGKNEETGVWQDRRAKEYFPQSNYAYSRSELYFDIDGQHDATWITMKVDHADIEANLGNGEHWIVPPKPFSPQLYPLQPFPLQLFPQQNIPPRRFHLLLKQPIDQVPRNTNTALSLSAVNSVPNLT